MQAEQTTWRQLPRSILCRGAAGLLLLAAALTPAVSTAASCLDSGRLTGVNLAGAEFAPERRPGKVDVDYVYPKSADIDALRDAGFNVLRLPVLWERLQPRPKRPLKKQELGHLRRTVAAAHRAGLCVIIDLHNYGAYWGKPVGTKDVPRSVFIDLWKRLALEFGKDAGVAFGLMNEPHHMQVEEWRLTAAATVKSLRQRGSRNLILVAGGRWSGAHDWHVNAGGSSNAEAFRSFRDASGRTLIEVHQYADPEFSGTGKKCIAAKRLKAFLDDVGTWAKKNKQRLFLGEVGTGPDPDCLVALDAMLTVAGKDPWHGWTYWAAGEWLGDYPYRVQPRSDVKNPQMKLLKKHARQEPDQHKEKG